MGNLFSTFEKKKDEDDSKFKKSDLKKKQNFRKMVKNQKIVIGEPLKNTFTHCNHMGTDDVKGGNIDKNVFCEVVAIKLEDFEGMKEDTIEEPKNEKKKETEEIKKDEVTEEGVKEEKKDEVIEEEAKEEKKDEEIKVDAKEEKKEVIEEEVKEEKKDEKN
jgi:hypothetical protein